MPDSGSLIPELSGKQLYGEDLSPEEIMVWYEQESNGYFNLLSEHYSLTDDNGQYIYEYESLNRLHAVKFLLQRRFPYCVALGCAAGDDVAPLAPVVDRFLAIEPAEKWWRQEIGGKPAQYVKPSVLGDIEIENNTADLATSFGVLHHIPNVSHVVSEVARVLRPGGFFVVREPISWMGDWRKPRAGLTANERGLPLGWFEATTKRSGFKIVRRRLCMLSPFAIIAKMAGISRPYANMPITLVDWLLSEMLRWNIHYQRDRFSRKIAPGSAFWLLEKRSG